jgi:GntR family transcriptional repressor for pyruvate dehydrogenase complex
MKMDGERTYQITLGIDNCSQKNVLASGHSVSYHDLLSSTKRADRIIPAILQYITDFGLKENDKLPPQRDMCKMLGVGNCSLREALIVLQSLGVLRSRHGLGWFIDKFDPKNSLRFLSPLLEKLSGIDNIAEIMEMRLSHEPLVAYKAAKNISEQGLAQLDDCLQIMKKNIDDPVKEFREVDRLFHEIIARECGSEVLSIISTIMAGLLFNSVMWVNPKSNAEDIITHHQRIYDCIAEKNAKGAAQAMKFHLLEGWDFLYECGIIKQAYEDWMS